jgi:hypothetical protein
LIVRYLSQSPHPRSHGEAGFLLSRTGMGATEVARTLKIGRASVYRMFLAINGVKNKGINDGKNAYAMTMKRSSVQILLGSLASTMRLLP